MGLAGCASGPGGGRGGRDGPGANPPADLDRVADAEPQIAPIASSGGTSKPYSVRGRSYAPITDDRPFRERGLASWYGRKFHAESTASGEPYDMYGMTAAHKTLPLPSYARVRNPANGREVIVRVNDRGPFVDGRIIDLSYTAALKLDLLRGVAPVEIERITNDDIRTGAWRRGAPAPQDATRLAQAQAPASTTDATAPPEARFESIAPAADATSIPLAMTTPVSTHPVEAVAAPEMMALAALPTLAPATRSAPMPVNDKPVSRPSSPAAGFWVQLGAFSQRDGAADLRKQVALALPSLADATRVFDEGGTHRVQAGPFASREEAQRAAEQIRGRLHGAAFILERP